MDEEVDKCVASERGTKFVAFDKRGMRRHPETELLCSNGSYEVAGHPGWRSLR